MASLKFPIEIEWNALVIPQVMQGRPVNILKRQISIELNLEGSNSLLNNNTLPRMTTIIK